MTFERVPNIGNVEVRQIGIGWFRGLGVIVYLWHYRLAIGRAARR